MKRIVIHPFIPAMVNIVERWLSRLSSQGLILVDIKGWVFVFEKKPANETEYFIYNGFDASKGFSDDFFRAKECYAKKKSKLNKLNRSIFEVDTTKIDEGFLLLLEMRNQYYKNHYLILFIMSLLLGVLCAVFSCYNQLFLYFFMVFIIWILYSTVSIIILFSYNNQ